MRKCTKVESIINDNTLSIIQLSMENTSSNELIEKKKDSLIQRFEKKADFMLPSLVINLNLDMLQYEIVDYEREFLDFLENHLSYEREKFVWEEELLKELNKILEKYKLLVKDLRKITFDIIVLPIIYQIGKKKVLKKKLLKSMINENEMKLALEIKKSLNKNEIECLKIAKYFVAYLTVNLLAYNSMVKYRLNELRNNTINQISDLIFSILGKIHSSFVLVAFFCKSCNLLIDKILPFFDASKEMLSKFKVQLFEKYPSTKLFSKIAKICLEFCLNELTKMLEPVNHNEPCENVKSKILERIKDSEKSIKIENEHKNLKFSKRYREFFSKLHNLIKKLFDNSKKFHEIEDIEHGYDHFDIQFLEYETVTLTSIKRQVLNIFYLKSNMKHLERVKDMKMSITDLFTQNDDYPKEFEKFCCNILSVGSL